MQAKKLDATLCSAAVKARIRRRALPCDASFIYQLKIFLSVRLSVSFSWWLQKSFLAFDLLKLSGFKLYSKAARVQKQESESPPLSSLSTTVERARACCEALFTRHMRKRALCSPARLKAPKALDKFFLQLFVVQNSQSGVVLTQASKQASKQQTTLQELRLVQRSNLILTPVSDNLLKS